MGIQMKILHLSAALLALVGMSACAGTTNEAKSSGDSNSGCPDEDPFCDEGGDSGSSDTSADDEGGSSSGSSIFGGNEETTPLEDFSVVIRTDKPKESKEEEEGEDSAKKKKPKKPTKKPKEGEAVYKVILHPKGLAYQMGSEQIAKLYGRLLDKQYVELYKKTPVGPQTKALDHELEEKKQLLRRHLLEFGNLPTGLDNTPLKGEYSYANNESYTFIDLENGIVRNLFFFDDALWKIYDEHKSGSKSPLGGSFESGVEYLADQLGAPPKIVEPDYAANRNFREAEWRDGTTLVRLVDRSPTLAVVFVSESVQGKLPSLLKNRLRDPTSVDSTVRDVTGPYKAGEVGDKKKKKK
jgi:hypothetical protein